MGKYADKKRLKELEAKLPALVSATSEAEGRRFEGPVFHHKWMKRKKDEDAARNEIAFLKEKAK